MPVIVNLSSENEGTLKNFLNSFFQKDSKLDDDVIEWINVFDEPLEAIDMITAVIDNKERFDIILHISIDPGLSVNVNQDNINDMVKFMLARFYNEEAG